MLKNINERLYHDLLDLPGFSERFLKLAEEDQAAGDPVAVFYAERDLWKARRWHQKGRPPLSLSPQTRDPKSKRGYGRRRSF